MDILPVKPSDESRGLKDGSTQRPSGPTDKEVGRGLGAETEGPSEAPETESVTASNEVDSGTTRDAAAQRETKDQSARLVEFLDSLGERTPEATRVEIEVDRETGQSRFVVLSRDSGEVLRKIPAEDLLPKLRELAEKGVLFDRRF